MRKITKYLTLFYLVKYLWHFEEKVTDNIRIFSIFPNLNIVKLWNKLQLPIGLKQDNLKILRIKELRICFCFICISTFRKQWPQFEQQYGPTLKRLKISTLWKVSTHNITLYFTYTYVRLYITGKLRLVVSYGKTNYPIESNVDILQIEDSRTNRIIRFKFTWLTF